MNKKIKIGIVIITGTITILLVILSFNFNSQAKKVASVVQPNIVMDKAIWEEPAQVAKKLAETSLLDNDYEYEINHIYCDSDCEKTLQRELNMSFKDSMNFDKKIRGFNEKVIIKNIETKEIEKTNEKAAYDISIDYGFKDSMATTGVGMRYTLEKRGAKWMLNAKDSLYGAISIYKNYIKILDDIEKCREAGPVIFNVSKEGGTFAISDKSNPLYGFSIRMPKLKEDINIKVGCFPSFLPISKKSFYISLPISIEMDKVFGPDIIASEESIPSPLLHSVKGVEEDPQLKGKWPLIEIPYYDVALDDSKILITGLIGSDNKLEDPKIDINYFPMEYDTNRKVLRGHFLYLNKSLAATENIQNVKL
ncbi:MAG: hypothetical protein COX29_00610 [Candidatus Moranbacteria bacterium CG23_combo_of_CG06-09_8_20_14_all_35_22]|nr:MAG: hypothetical protein COX29_00610 [Candidatus Moranbacteria bacterium CG23_combo_of_CG06-09_8_20_14_all_35_22]